MRRQGYEPRVPTRASGKATANVEAPNLAATAPSGKPLAS